MGQSVLTISCHLNNQITILTFFENILNTYLAEILFGKQVNVFVDLLRIAALKDIFSPAFVSADVISAVQTVSIPVVFAASWLFPQELCSLATIWLLRNTDEQFVNAFCPNGIPLPTISHPITKRPAFFMICFFKVNE